MSKQLLFDSQARSKLLTGINVVADAVGATLSPKGRNVAMDKKTALPHVVHDGVTVAREISLKDPFENMGAQLIKEAASRTNDMAGDGTTTATILTQAIANNSFKVIQSGGNPMILKKGMEKAVDALVEELKKISKKITTPEEKKQVAIISAQDEKIGSLIAEAVEKVGNDGIITVDESRAPETKVEYREGMQYDRGLNSPYYITDTDRMEAVLPIDSEQPVRVLVTDFKLQTQEQAVMVLERLLELKVDSVLIIGDYVEGDALITFVLNSQNMRKTIKIITTNAPGFGDRKRENLEDIAILTGAVLISEEQGASLSSFGLDDLGTAGKVISDQHSTLIADGRGKKEAIESRIKHLKNLISKTDSDYEKEKYSQRLAKLSSGVAIIKVGAMTQVERKEKKERAIDAISATQAAIDEGIVPGGEVALLKVSHVLDKIKAEGDELAGVNIIRIAITEPFKKLMSNAGLIEEYSIKDVRDAEFNFGVDVMDGQLKDLVKEGIIDPVKVTRSALQNAASSGIMIMTTDVLITDDPEEEGGKNVTS